MHIVVMGAGGVGGYFGAKLARAGETVTRIARGEHLRAIQRDGLRIRSSVEGESVVRLAAVEDVRGLSAAEVILFCVKSFDTETAAERIRPIVGPDTAVLSLQNGIDNEDTIDEILGPGHAMGGVAQVFAAIDRPGVIAHHFAGRIIFGELDGRLTPRAESLARAFARAAIDAELSTDIRRALWEKYVLICAVAGGSASPRRRSPRSTRRSSLTPRGGAPDVSRARGLAIRRALSGPLRRGRRLPWPRDACLARDPLDAQAGNRRPPARRGERPARTVRAAHHRLRARQRRGASRLAVRDRRRWAADRVRRAQRPLRELPRVPAALLRRPPDGRPDDARLERRLRRQGPRRLRRGEPRRHRLRVRRCAARDARRGPVADALGAGAIPGDDRAVQALQRGRPRAVAGRAGPARRPVGQGPGVSRGHGGRARLHARGAGHTRVRPRERRIPGTEPGARAEPVVLRAAHGAHRRRRDADRPLGGGQGGRRRPADPRRAGRVQRLSRVPRVAHDRAGLDAVDRAARLDVDAAHTGNNRERRCRGRRKDRTWRYGATALLSQATYGRIRARGPRYSGPRYN